MRAFKINRQLNKTLIFLAAAILLLSLDACVTKEKFLTSPVVPAAEGTVKVKKDKNDNYVINIELVNLAEPERLQPPMKVYNVYVVSKHDVIKKMGRISSSTSLFSNQLKASFETVSTLKPIKIFIMAENDVSNQYPDSKVILTTDEF